MAELPSETLGATDDTVRLTLNGDEVRIAESYEVSVGVLTQPCAFSLRLGHGEVIADLIAKYPPRTPFTLSIGGAVQFSGETDGYTASGEVGATELTIRGRDSLARLHDADVEYDKTFTDKTLRQIVELGLETVGVKNYTVVGNNATERAIRAGNLVHTYGDADSDSSTAHSAIHAKLGETWYEFIKRHLDRAGLFLWAGSSQNLFVVSEPRRNQVPTYRFVRGRQGVEASIETTNAESLGAVNVDNNVVNVERATFHNETTGRFSHCTIYSRQGGRRGGRARMKGGFSDSEMIDLGYDRGRVFRDVNVTSPAQAEFYARRKIAEANRRGWQLIYELSGHTVPTQGGKRAVLTPDTLADVHDDEFGIHELLYVESVTFSRPPTMTRVVLMRPADLVFASDE